jgi:hypothetical protein
MWQTLPSRPRTQRPRQSSRAGRGRRTARRAAPRFCLDFDARTSTTTALTVHDDSFLRSPRLLRDGTSTLMYSAAVVCGAIRLSKARCQRMLVRERSDVACRLSKPRWLFIYALRVATCVRAPRGPFCLAGGSRVLRPGGGKHQAHAPRQDGALSCARRTHAQQRRAALTHLPSSTPRRRSLAATCTPSTFYELAGPLPQCGEYSARTSLVFTPTPPPPKLPSAALGGTLGALQPPPCGHVRSSGDLEHVAKLKL